VLELSRRQMLGAAAGAATLALGAPPALAGELVLRDLTVDGDAELGRRFTLFTPRGLARDERVPLVILLHGLGEAGDPRAGAYAWTDRYGLATSYDRLRTPPIQRTSKRLDWTDARLGQVNADLLRTPFRGLALACPVTPNVAKLKDPGGALDRYASWLVDVVVPRARKEAPVVADAAHTHLDGCSMGGFVGLEVFLRRPDVFGAWGGVQSAFGAQRAAGYADRLAKVVKKIPRPIHLETSEQDPFREANQLLSSELKKRAVPHQLQVLPGPHDQPWLREAGTIEMLLWHDRLPR
jgi:pimeloyl-ACP methyl ester carboxylesterase